MKAPKLETSSKLEGRLREVGADLRQVLVAILQSLPGYPHRPSRLAQELGVNRAVASKVLAAIVKTDPLETLHLIPGPEPLRKLVRSAEGLGATSALARAAEEAIANFDHVIRNEAGNRAALDALISSSLPGARERFELASKYSVYKGLAQLKGVQAEHWLGTAILSPSNENAKKHDLTWLNGAVAMQRLRPGATVRFSYRQGLDNEGTSEIESSLPTLGLLPLDQFCVNPAAQLEAHVTGDTIHYTLSDDLVGPQETVDMFVVDHHPASVRRESAGPKGRRTSFFVEPAMPVANLTFDTILHRDVFPGADPELLIYDTGYDGIVDVNDPARQIDRVPLKESVEVLGLDISRFEAPGIPTYGPLLQHLCDRFGWKSDEFRGYRTKIAYPVYGWQVCLAFEPELEKG
ncbi:MAG: hypothetical protein ACI8X5_002496 [Planctomycetota bacterium]|jgi:hypothetical protein